MKCNIVTGSHFLLFLFLIAVSLCTSRRSNEEFILSLPQINIDFLDLFGLRC